MCHHVKVSPYSTTHNIKRFYKEVWGISLPFDLPADVDSSWCDCFDLHYAGVHICIALQLIQKTWMSHIPSN